MTRANKQAKQAKKFGKKKTRRPAPAPAKVPDKAVDEVAALLQEPLQRTRTSLDGPLTKAFCKLVLEGLPLDACCDYLGIQTTTYYDWKRKGELYLTGAGEPKEFEAYGRFVLLVRRAVAEYRRRLGLEAHSSPRTWVRAVTILERRDKANYARYEVAGGGAEDLRPDPAYD